MEIRRQLFIIKQIDNMYRWQKRFNGTLESLDCKSRRPKSHPNQHKKRNPNEALTVFWVKLRLRGYNRSIPSLFRMMSKIGFLKEERKKSKYVPKPYESMP